MDRDTKITPSALDEAVAKIGGGAWWHGSVDNNGSRAIIELSSEPDETDRKWTASIVTEELDDADVLAMTVADGAIEEGSDADGARTYRLKASSQTTLDLSPGSGSRRLSDIAEHDYHTPAVQHAAEVISATLTNLKHSDLDQAEKYGVAGRWLDSDVWQDYCNALCILFGDAVGLDGRTLMSCVIIGNHRQRLDALLGDVWRIEGRRRRARINARAPSLPPGLDTV